VFERYALKGNGPQPFCNGGPVDAWQFYRDPGVLSQQCFYGKNRPITCPESESCHHQYTFCNFAARVWKTTALSIRVSVWRCFGYPYIGKTMSETYFELLRSSMFLLTLRQGFYKFSKNIFHTFSILNWKSSMPLLLFIFGNSESSNTILHIEQHCIIMNCFAFSKIQIQTIQTWDPPNDNWYN